MNIYTIEQNFDYQVNHIMAELLAELEIDPDTLQGEDLDTVLWDNRALLGQKLYEAIGSYQDQDDWLKGLRND